MRIHSLMFVVVCLILSCKSEQNKSEAEAVLDPWLVEKLGPDYKEKINWGIAPSVDDTIQQLVFPDSVFLFDAKSWQQKFVLKIPYENVGKKPSKFYQSFSSCQCIDQTPKKEYLNPGQKDELTLTFDPRKWQRGQSHSFSIVSEHFPHLNTLIIERK